MINTDFDCNYMLNREELFHFLRKTYGYTCSFEPCIHPAVIMKYYYNEMYNSGKCECCLRVTEYLSRQGEWDRQGSMQNSYHTYLSEWSCYYYWGQIFKTSTKSI